jgi:CRISPR-associated protein Cmr2
VVSWQVDISIGPVQGFVRDSRRTRDLWGSSYLLSFLAAHAMVGAADAGGQVAAGDDPMYASARAVRDGTTVAQPPAIGTVPNHFQVVVDGDPKAVAGAAQDALQHAWQRVCDAVRGRFVEPLEGHGDGTGDIWHRQVGSFWQVVWVAGEDGGGSLLARRKQWRSHYPPEEPGDKCTVMHTFQELSGYTRAAGRDARDSQDAFWAHLRGTRDVGLLDLREDERLCAIALVKRLFPAVAEAALGWPLEVGRWPSTLWVGGLPWLREVQEVAPAVADRYAAAVKRLAEGAVRNLDGPAAALAPPGELARRDANYLHRGFVADRRLCPLPQGNDRDRAELRELISRLYDTESGDGVRRKRVGSPPVYYALLVADGDKVGEVVTSYDRECVGRALADFAGGADRQDGVEAVVHEHSGVTVYAGGDDVLAISPVRDALRCAAALAERYRAAFRSVLGDVDRLPTLSAAVVFGHVRMPLVTVLTESKRLLEEVAKERNNRDSLAVAVVKPGGIHCEWVSHWARPGPDGLVGSAVAQLEDMVKQFRKAGPGSGFSSSLLHRARESISLLCGDPRWRPGVPQDLPHDLDARAYLRADIYHSLATRDRVEHEDGEDDRLTWKANELTDLVWSLLRHSADAGGSPPSGAPGREQVSLDPLLLARFLADEGREEEHL